MSSTEGNLHFVFVFMHWALQCNCQFGASFVTNPDADLKGLMLHNKDSVSSFLEGLKSLCEIIEFVGRLSASASRA